MRQGNSGIWILSLQKKFIFNCSILPRLIQLISTMLKTSSKWYPDSKSSPWYLWVQPQNTIWFKWYSPAEGEIGSDNWPPTLIPPNMIHRYSEGLICNIPSLLKAFNDVIALSKHIKNVFSHLSRLSELGSFKLVLKVLFISTFFDWFRWFQEYSSLFNSFRHRLYPSLLNSHCKHLGTQSKHLSDYNISLQWLL